MTESPAFVYELTLEVEQDAADELDFWLTDFVEAMLARPGFDRASTFSAESDGRRARRIVRFPVADDTQLRLYLGEPEPDAQAELKRVFGPDAHATGRILESGPAFDTERAPRAERCLNCDFLLAGQYCGQCGQRAQSRLIRLHELIREAFGDLFELDSRLWRTLVPLAVRPGRLTRDYLQGRRARFMPPFRMYLVLSLAFFLIAFFDPEEKLGILFEPEPSPAADTRGPLEAQTDTPAAAEPGDADDTTVEPGPEDADIRIALGDDEDRFDCNFDDYDAADMPMWLSRRLTRERLTAACENIVTEDGQGIRGLIDRMIENIPAGLFILLPVMAFVLMMLHPLSGRYYVEHLLFVIHYHSFVFLILSADILFSRLVVATPLPDALTNLATLATVIYIPVYLFRSMRRVYEGSRAVTFFRFSLLSIAYFAGLGVIVGIAALIAAFSV